MGIYSENVIIPTAFFCKMIRGKRVVVVVVVVCLFETD